MLIWIQDGMLTQLHLLDKTVVPVTFNPTAENMAKFLVEVVGPLQLSETGVELVQCRIEETRKCFCTYTKESKA